MSYCQVKSGREEVRVDRLLPQGRVFQRQIPTQMAGLIWGGRNKQLRNRLFLLESDKLKTKSATQVALLIISVTRLVVGYPRNQKTNSIAPYLETIWTCFLSATVKKMLFIFTSAPKRRSLRGGEGKKPQCQQWHLGGLRSQDNIQIAIRESVIISDSGGIWSAGIAAQTAEISRKPMMMVEGEGSSFYAPIVQHIDVISRRKSGIERKILPSLQPLVNGFRKCWLPDLARLQAHVASVNMVFNLFKPACLKTRLWFSAVCRYELRLNVSVAVSFATN